MSFYRYAINRAFVQWRQKKNLTTLISTVSVEQPKPDTIKQSFLVMLSCSLLDVSLVTKLFCEKELRAILTGISTPLAQINAIAVGKITATSSV